MGSVSAPHTGPLDQPDSIARGSSADRAPLRSRLKPAAGIPGTGTYYAKSTLVSRVNRGLEKLRAQLIRQGFAAATPGAVTAALSSLPLPSAPATLIEALKGLTALRAGAQGQETEETICAELQATGAVDFAEIDQSVPPALLPNDTYYSSQWFQQTLNSPGAWDLTTGNANVIVAVCDGGVDAAHPDLAANLNLPGLNTVDGTSNTSDLNGHGTKGAGCIGAIGNNGAGVCGVAWNIKILSVRVTNDPSGAFSYYSDMAEAITWSADQGAKVVNMSYMA